MRLLPNGGDPQIGMKRPFHLHYVQVMIKTTVIFWNIPPFTPTHPVESPRHTTRAALSRQNADSTRSFRQNAKETAG